MFAGRVILHCNWSFPCLTPPTRDVYACVSAVNKEFSAKCRESHSRLARKAFELLSLLLRFACMHGCMHEFMLAFMHAWMRKTHA